MTGRAGGLCCFVIHAYCHRYHVAAAVRLSWAAESGREFHLLLRSILLHLSNYYPNTVLPCSVCHACAVHWYAVCHSWELLSNLFFLVGSPRFCAGGPPSATTKTLVNILANTIPCLVEPMSEETIKPIQSIATRQFHTNSIYVLSPRKQQF